jgi:transcriptional regulator with XRE-family HTH domain
MDDFAHRLRSLIEYRGLLQKEVAAKAGIKKRALDMYLGTRKSIPPADIAVKLASVLGVTVEFLITGRPNNPSTPTDDMLVFQKYTDIIDDLSALSEKSLGAVKTIAKSLADAERSSEKR